MDTTEYGPFASIIAIAAALVAAFSLLILKSVGPVGRWTKQIGQGPSFVVTAGARALAVALIAAAFLLINKNNYLIFAAIAILFGVSTIVLIALFDRLRRTHVCQVPVVGQGGAQTTNARGEPVFDSLIIGTESDMLPNAKRDFTMARKRRGGLSLADFMSGYGATKVNNPSAIWSTSTLAAIGNKLTVILMGILLAAVMSLYLAASAIEVSQRAN